MVGDKTGVISGEECGGIKVGDRSGLAEGVGLGAGEGLRLGDIIIEGDGFGLQIGSFSKISIPFISGAPFLA